MKNADKGSKDELKKKKASAVASDLPAYRNEKLSFEERAKDLVSRMSVEECAGQMLFNAPAVDRLGIKSFNWWNEALHGVARSGLATVFPQAIGLAAAFDAELTRKIADVISTEGRAKFNSYQKFGDHDIYKGLTFWSPNINIFRDPRWGRGHETFGEDPFLTARLGEEFVHGIQGDHPRYLKAAACAKHYAVHSGPEAIRHEFNAIASPKDLWETYLPAFETLAVKAKVAGFMGAYNRTNGEPCCGSKTLLVDILRKKWGFRGYVTSDCWAIKDFHMFHKVTSNAIESVSLAIKNGCDLNCGNLYGHIMEAYNEGALTEEDIRTAATNLMTIQMRLGFFDQNVPFDNIPYDVVDSADHRAFNYDVSAKSLVLLKNRGKTLPLSARKLRTIAVIGPNADSQGALKGNYHGTAGQWHTILEGVVDAFPKARVLYSEGCHIYKDKVQNLGMIRDRDAEVLQLIEMSDAVVLAVGLDEFLEGEEGDAGNAYASGDKKDLLLPSPQRHLITLACDKANELHKPIVLVNVSGSSIDLLDGNDKADAIIQAFYPGAEGGRAVADLLRGTYSPSGRLPVTFYANDNTIPDFTDYSMENRTYRFFQEKPLYPFGFGLSYTAFDYDAPKLSTKKAGVGQGVGVKVKVTNTGKMAGDEIVQVYVRVTDADVRVPNFQLCGFKRVALAPGETKQVDFQIDPASLQVVLDDGRRVAHAGTFELFVGGAQPDARSEELTGTAVKKVTFQVQ